MHPDMESILAETYGVALYQEQVIRIANVLAGFSMAEGDGLRKAMGKKLPEEMAKYRDRFVSGAVQRGTGKALAGDIFDTIERFAGYGFNKAHSAAYAVIAAQTAYLKANYPVEFMAALLSSEIGNTDKIVAYANECRRAGIALLPPDVNRSGVDFTVEPIADERLAVRWGLAAVKNAGEGAVEAILEAREAQPAGQFAHLDALCESVDWTSVNRRVVESLGRAGALDCFGPRGAVLAALEACIASGQRRQKAASRGQMGLFGGETSDQGAVASPLPDSAVSQKELLSWEKELLGLYLSSHPLQDVLGAAMPPCGIARIIDIGEKPTGQPVKLIAMVVGVRRITTRTNRTMAVAEIEDLTGSIEAVAFPDLFERCSDILQPDTILEFTAKVDRRGESLQLVCESVSATLSALPSAPPTRRRVHVSLTAAADRWEDIAMMQEVEAQLRQFEGDDDVILHVPYREGRTVRMRSRSRRVEWCPMLEQALVALRGVQRVMAEEPAHPKHQAQGAA